MCIISHLILSDGNTTVPYSKWLGYHLDGHSVLFTDDDAFLIVVRRTTIFGISLNPEVNTDNAMVPISGMESGYDVEVDYSEQFLYYADYPVSFEKLPSI